ncbi:MAG TPA: TonB-dependent receptor, partial [Rhizomicrobium sp.]|nr:TonB-dependent receptor [Rhizomicrobium sp.]
ALDSYARQANVQLMYPDDEMKNARTAGVQGELTADVALSRILSGTGFMTQHVSGAIAIVRAGDGVRASLPVRTAAPIQVAAASAANVETIVVTSSKIKGDIQTVPIAITALSQEQLTSRQIAGGPDLVKEVPNLTFSKTNFTGYNIEIRGIGTQAISVTTDPAVAVSFNDVPFLRNHFFEQEFYDVSQVEVLRGPQGTLYGRNATAGVVNVISAKPTDHFEAMASADWGNFTNRRYEGMVNIPILSDELDLRVAGEWTKRNGYSFNEETHQSTDGRDLWSSRVSLLIHPLESLTATAIWEHFQEDDDRLRSGKQLCEKDPGPSVVDGPAGPQIPDYDTNLGAMWLSQGCKPTSLYAATAFETPNAGANPFIAALDVFQGYIVPYADPYSSTFQSRNLRVIDSLIEPHYSARNDTYEFNVDFAVTAELTLTSQTGYNRDSLYSTEDFDRFDTKPGFFIDPGGETLVGQDGQFCDPQLGCSDRLVSEDVSQESAHQFYQEVRLQSNYSGPLNFVAGANYMKYRTLEDYDVFANVVSLETEFINWGFGGGSDLPADAPHIPFDASIANSCGPQPASAALLAQSFLGLGCAYVDPNPLSQINGNGHNYFRSENPYSLSSWAGFGELYYNFTPDLKLTGGLRYTDDKKHFVVIPSWALDAGEGLPVASIIDQEWRELTGRANLTWTPKLDFTDQSMFYASYAHGYKGGGANPPG